MRPPSCFWGAIRCTPRDPTSNGQIFMKQLSRGFGEVPFENGSIAKPDGFFSEKPSGFSRASVEGVPDRTHRTRTGTRPGRSCRTVGSIACDADVLVPLDERVAATRSRDRLPVAESITERRTVLRHRHGSTLRAHTQRNRSTKPSNPCLSPSALRTAKRAS